MKKYIKVSLLLVIMFIVVGCGKKDNNNNNTTISGQPTNDKKLICSTTESEKKYKETIKLTINYSEEKISKVSINSIYEYTSGKYDSKESKNQANDCTKALKNRGVTCSTKSQGKEINTVYTFNLLQMDDVSRNMSIYSFFKELENEPYDSLKTKLEESNYLCN